MALQLQQLEVGIRRPTSPSLRFCEEKGLISPVARQRLRRVFSDNIIERLALIALGRAAGFSLNEIAGMIRTKGSPDIDITGPWH